jgi:FkbM family methyltransferase
MLNHAKRSFAERMPTFYDVSRELKRKASNPLYRKSVVERQYGGHFRKVHIHDPMARDWYNCSRSLLPEIDLVHQHGLHDGALVFGSGAHQNIIALVLAREVQPAGRTIAVEGSKHNAEIGRLNVKAKSFTNVMTAHAVVGAAEGQTTFSQSYNGEIISTERQSGLLFIPSVTIDGAAQEYGTPNVIFIDIEGYEMEAIQGAAKTLLAPAT